jgi:hypothetical protein
MRLWRERKKEPVRRGDLADNPWHCHLLSRIFFVIILSITDRTVNSST